VIKTVANEENLQLNMVLNRSVSLILPTVKTCDLSSIRIGTICGKIQAAYHQSTLQLVTFEVLTVVKVSTLLFWILMPCGLGGSILSLQINILSSSSEVKMRQ
jgi:hypothetical protein